ncbi:hypothetical protein E8E13_005928 [Curvularia kusanoi]|uniref:DUF7626 domain-containing protein n=1 Tax=Curvularia kusanoi TaxID=90978 RepID=A0A9P4T8M2_CURKU|nr:hypothetical protein E8E13_005928 [Curvularia kusanoi]
MADLNFNFDDPQFADDPALQDDVRMRHMASDDDDDEDFVPGPLDPDSEMDEKLDMDGGDNLRLFAADTPNLDDDDYIDAAVGKKRKLAGAGVPNTKDKLANARIKTEGGEALILEEGESSVAQKRSTLGSGAINRDNRNRATTHRRVTADLSSDDKRMLEMRDDGYNDRQIRDKLIEEGRIHYDTKSISTRIMRIRLAQAENHDVQLEQGYKEWQQEDDQLLVQAYALADIEVSYEVERVRAWRFRKVSEYMRRLNKDSMFSANACRTRYTQLMAGTAVIPCAVSDDPDARRLELDSFRTSNEAVRAKEASEQHTRSTMEKAVKDSAKIKKAQKAEEIANKRAQLEQEKADRAMQRAAAAQLRSQKAAENMKARAQRNAQIMKAASVKPSTASSPLRPPPSKKAKFDAPDPSPSAQPDPRSYLSTRDLTTLCTNRGLLDPKTPSATTASRKSLLTRSQTQTPSGPTTSCARCARRRVSLPVPVRR